jgi:hypothetical protein
MQLNTTLVFFYIKQLLIFQVARFQVANSFKLYTHQSCLLLHNTGSQSVIAHIAR